jgi:UDP-2,3-diacylglucosamine hydrolase
LKTFQLPENPALVVASDVHVRTETDERYLLLCQLVELAAEKKTKTLVLNGDIFDFFFGWGSYFQNKYSRLLHGLDKLAASGALVWFVEGNHEFGMDSVQKKFRFDVVPSHGRVWMSPQGKKFLIAHGDLLQKDFKYELFRALIRSWLVSFVAFCVPQWLLDQFTLWFATTSRKKDKYRVLRHELIGSCAKQQLVAAGGDVIIFGHFHHPYDEDLGDGKRMLSVSSWDEPSCLVVTEDGSISRILAQ